MLKLDLHLHSQYSEDGAGSPREIIKSLQKKGLQGMAVTDHNTVKGGLQAIRVAPKRFIVIPGIEISSKDGHIIGLNVKEDIPRGLTAEETVEQISSLGGTPIVPHLFRNMSGIKRGKLQKIYPKLTAIEVFNACSLLQTNMKTAKVAQQLHLGGTGGSDSHDPQYVGYAYTTVNTTDTRADSILSEIEKKNTWGEGNIMPLEYRQDRMALSIKQFFQRGLKRI
ncbi:MAG: PHP domain-containing protein [Candidatus Thermoplasmatota archaeon]|nr:PHP domain-containing protein [Candidatus Thermoplasmatota archaeon]